MKIKLAFFFLLLLFSCKKDPKETSLNLRVNSYSSLEYLDQVEVSFLVKKVSGGTFSNAFYFEEKTTTDTQGKAILSFLKTSSDIEYKIELKKENYQFEEIFINPSSINAGESNQFQYEMLPIGSVNVNIKSGANAGVNDFIQFSLSSNCKTCCSYSLVPFIGNQVDTSFSCNVIADKFFKYTYVLNRSGNSTQILDSAKCAKGQSVSISIVY